MQVDSQETADSQETMVASMTDVTLPLASATPFQHKSPPMKRWEYLALGAITVLIIFLDFFNLAADGYPNDYYATAVKSMLHSWHNFFFLSFDPGGFVTIDKPPLAFWLQTLSAKIFGFNGVSLVLPQTIAGVVSVLVLFHLVRRTFGVPAGLIAALALTLSPISLVANRNNIVDSLLTMIVLLATWVTLKAAEEGSLVWLLVAGVLIGLGFNTKALEAYLVVPALVLVFFFGAPLPWWRRAVYLLLMLGVMLVVSLSWCLAVDLTPASERPYVGSSMTNSEIELALGYNGIQRIFKIHPTPSRPDPPKGTNTTTISVVSTAVVSATPAATHTPTVTKTPAPTHTPTATKTVVPVQTPEVAKTEPVAKPAAPVLHNDPGPTRLFQPYLGGQIGWLLPLGIAALLASAWQLRPRSILRSWARKHFTVTQQGFVLWGIWGISEGIIFSAANSSSPYYMVVFAPAVAALAGIGLVYLWRDFWERGSWLLPLALIATSVEQAYILSGVPQWLPWLAPTLVVVAVALALILVVLRLLGVPRRVAERWPRLAPGAVALPILMISVLLAPALWTFGSLHPADEGDHPISGPTLRGPTVRAAPTADPALIAYLRSHANGASFLVATLNTGTATPIIFDTDAPVMAMGGFSGNNPILTTDDLTTLVANNVVTLFYLPSTNLSQNQIRTLFPEVTTPPKTMYSNALARWVSTYCQPISPAEWSSNSSARHIGSMILYTCADLVTVA